MSWVAFALSSAAIAGIVAIIDSHLLSKKMPGLRSYLLPVGAIQFAFGLILFFIFPFPENTSALTLSIAFGAGFSSSFAIFLMLSTMRRSEVSRIIPVVNTSPIFVAIMAVPLLDELLGYKEWLAILLAVAGVILISLQQDDRFKNIRLNRLLFPLLLSSMLFAVSNIALKYVLEDISYWNMFSISTLCFAVVFFSFSLRPSVLRQLKSMSKLHRSMSLLVFNEFAAASAGILSFLAISNGPVSAASTILNTRPAFVFLFALTISQFFPQLLNERFSKSVVLIRFIAIAMIVGSVALLTLK